MTEMGDLFRALKEESSRKRADNRVNGAALLHKNDVAFESKNDGAHLIVDAGVKGKIDYWPGTGRWTVRLGGRTGRGINKLLGMIKNKHEEKLFRDVA
jgi:hypothetical protein